MEERAMTKPSNVRRSDSRNGRPPAKPFLKEEAYEQIKERLLNNEYPPGSFLSERRLADSLGMSKTPVKTALDRLESEGYIAVSPQQGIVVREMSVREIADQYEIRAALESYVLKTVAGRLTPPQLALVQTNLKTQDRLRGGGSVHGWVEIDAAFHLLFVQFLANQEILRVISQLREKMERVITQVFHLRPGHFDTSCDDHRKIADAVASGKGPRAAELIVRHLERGRQLILSPRR
jgi:DNA-binding GntR family transcriptional regulator